MKTNYSYLSWTRRIAFSVATFCVAAAAAHAQTLVTYGTGFDGTDTINGAPTSATYNSPAADPTDPLSGQKQWSSNDITQTSGGPTQLNGQSDYVGTLGYFSGQSGALGGVYRNPAPTTAAPDVVPSTTNGTGGLITLFHGAAVPASSTFISLNVDFSVTSPVNRSNLDTFGLSLSNAAGASVLSFNFSPGSAPGTQDSITYSANGGPANPFTTIATTSSVALDGKYHLTMTIDPKMNTFTASITGASTVNYAGSVTAGLSIAQFAATWKLGDTATQANGGYTGADDNYLIFDNVSVAVPEPSTYAMMALGLTGLGVLLRRRKVA